MNNIIEEVLQLNYTVRPGDNIWSIATRFGTTPQAIMRRNGITNPNAIYVGQTIIIPVPGPGPVPPPAPYPQDLVRRVERLERRVERLDRRVTRLEQGRVRYEDQY